MIQQATLALAIVFSLSTSGDVRAQALEKQLLAESAAELAADAREFGDEKRGAIVFYQLGCTRCHIADKANHRLGPDLTKLSKDVSDQELVDSVLRPSKAIRKGFEPVTLVTKQGGVSSGILVSDADGVVTIRAAEKNFKIVQFKKSDLANQSAGKTSIMPAGQVNMLGGRQQFLDLANYLRVIRDGGAAKAKLLEPSPSLYLNRPLPEYESRVDHAGILSSLDNKAAQRGSQIYNRLCVNCHGTKDALGSLPTSLKFASDKFKNGNDPYSMYRTLTHGFGQMIAQTWMVPTQKYDVIHYIRKEYLEKHNKSQLFEITPDYLAGLPKGDTRGPAPSKIVPWEQMDYGPNLVMTLEIGNNAKNFAYKGNAIRLDIGPGGVSKGSHWMIYDYDTMRVAAAWSGENFTDYNGINFNGRHAIHPRLTGDLQLQNPTGPGWARTSDGSFEDVRLVGRDKRIYGPLPRAWAQYKGMYYHGPHTIMNYTVGRVNVLERPGLLNDAALPVFTRTLNVGSGSETLTLQVGYIEGVSELKKESDHVVFGNLAVGLAGETGQLQWSVADGNLRLSIPAGDAHRRFTLWFAKLKDGTTSEALASTVVIDDPTQDLRNLMKGGPARWPDVLTTEAEIGKDDGPFAVDVIRRPTDNPWFCRMRLTGFDFTEDGDRAYVSAWDGSIWLVSGLNGLPAAGGDGSKSKTVKITWRRVASGLFQPLGVKIVDGKVYVTCRDQIAILHDLNGDEEFDYFESFNNDHQVTDHFHEFAMGLQVDEKGNFYYAKSARHAKTALVPHHGTLLRVSKDGKKTDILAKGFRAANGVCLNPDGTFIVTDQEGHWNPKNRINYVKEGGFYGNMYGYHDVTDSSDEAMEQPLCWITNSFDRSPAELLWVESKRWGPLDGKLLNLSYGYGKVYVVPHEKIDGQPQGGMCELPVQRFPTGTMRGRFHKKDGQLYVAGMVGWASSQRQPGGLYRIRYTGKPVQVPVGLQAKTKSMTVEFSGALDKESATDEGNYTVKVWNLKRTRNYGSKHYDERKLAVRSASVSEDGKTVRLEIPEIAKTWSMEIRYRLKAADGKTFEGKIHNTIHKLGKE